MRALAVALAVSVPVLLGAAPAGAQEPPGPYQDPPFADACTVRDFDEGEAPALGSLDDDPLCVRYQKRDITVANGGALEFLLAEPERVAAALVCQYWQQDFWRIQLAPGDDAVVAWDGSYWFDRGAGSGGVVFRDFRILGQPAGADAVAALVEPLSAEFADLIRTYGEGAEGGTGGAVSLGGGDPTCAAAAAPAEPELDAPTDDGAGGQPAGGSAVVDAAETLPATGPSSVLAHGLVLGLVAASAWLAGRRTSR